MKRLLSLTVCLFLVAVHSVNGQTSGSSVGQTPNPFSGANITNVIATNLVISNAVANTNQIYFVGSSSNVVNGLYVWASNGSYTNSVANGVFLWFDPVALCWELTNNANGIIFDTIGTRSFLGGSLSQPIGGSWYNTVGGSAVELSMTSIPATNVVTTTVDSNVLLDNGSQLTNLPPGVLSLAVSNALAATYWQTSGTNGTIFVDNVLGNDTTCVVGNPSLPALTLTNAYTLVPTNGAIWLKYGQSFLALGPVTGSGGSPKPIITWNKDAVIIANGCLIRGVQSQQEFFKILSGRIEIWGGTWDSYTNAMTYSLFRWETGGSTNSTCLLHYCNLLGWEDVLFPISDSNPVSILLDKCTTYTIFDTFNNQQPGVCTVDANDCTFVADDLGPDLLLWKDPSILVRNWNVNVANGGYFRFNNCDFISRNQQNSTKQQFSYFAGDGAHYFRNCRFFGGTQGTNWFSICNTNTASVHFDGMDVPWQSMVTNATSLVFQDQFQAVSNNYTGNFDFASQRSRTNQFASGGAVDLNTNRIFFITAASAVTVPGFANLNFTKVYEPIFVLSNSSASAWIPAFQNGTRILTNAVNTAAFSIPGGKTAEARFLVYPHLGQFMTDMVFYVQSN